MSALARSVALAFCLMGMHPAAQATMLVETATGSPLASGLVVGDYFWPIHRFEITSPTAIHSVGGYFDNLSPGPISIFGAVVALSGSDDVPDSLDLSTPDVLGSTLVAVMPADGVHWGSFPLSLTPGWYALAFGAGAFGADSVSGVDLIMPSLAIDLDAQLPFTAIQAGNAYGTPPQFLAQLASPQFLAAPEPSTLALLAAGFAGAARLAGSGRHRSGRKALRAAARAPAHA